MDRKPGIARRSLGSSQNVNLTTLVRLDWIGSLHLVQIDRQAERVKVKPLR
jgi:hypothetical protein